MPRPTPGDTPPPDSARIKQSVLADYVDLVLRIKQARAILAWHMMQPAEKMNLHHVLQLVDDVLVTDPINDGPRQARSPTTQLGPFPPAPTFTVGEPPWETSPAGDDYTPMDPLKGVGFTDREREVLNILASGAGNAEIGRRLNLSTQTIKVHLQRMSRKLNVHGRGQLVAKGYRVGLLGGRKRRNGKPNGGTP